MFAHVKGSFKTFDASIHTTGKDFTTAQIDLWIDAFFITMGHQKRDQHLQVAYFFDVQKHKQIHFNSASSKRQMQMEIMYNVASSSWLASQKICN